MPDKIRAVSAVSVAHLTADSGVPIRLVHTFVMIDREIISMFILLLLLIQEGLLSVTSESMCASHKVLFNHALRQACPGGNVVR